MGDLSVHEVLDQKLVSRMFYPIVVVALAYLAKCEVLPVFIWEAYESIALSGWENSAGYICVLQREVYSQLPGAMLKALGLQLIRRSFVLV